MNGATETLTKQAVRAAYGWNRAKDWKEAIRLLGEAAHAGEPNAARQYELVTQVDVEGLLSPPRVQPQSTIIRVGLCRGFALPGFSEWLIEKGEPRLIPSLAKGPDDDRNPRTALNTHFGPRERDLIVAALQERAARICQVPIEYHEPPNIISYQVGQEFKPHVDYLDPAVPQLKAELDYVGQRTVTFVTYLNEDFGGAETEFLHANLKLRGRTGDCIVLLNVHPNGSPDYNTVHRAPSPTRGRKWVLSQWIRNKPFPFRKEDLV